MPKEKESSRGGGMKVRDRLSEWKFRETWRWVLVAGVLLLMGGIGVGIAGGRQSWSNVLYDVASGIGIALVIASSLFYFERVAGRRVGAGRPPMVVYFRKVRRELRVMGISLHDLQQPYQDEFQSYMSMLWGRFGDSKGGGHGLECTFLLMDPSSTHLVYRAMVEGKQPAELQREIKEAKSFLAKLRGSCPAAVKMEVYQYDAAATHSLIWVDDTMYVGPYFRGVAGTNSLWVTVKEDQDRELYNQLKKDFEKIMAGATRVP